MEGAVFFERHLELWLGLACKLYIWEAKELLEDHMTLYSLRRSLLIVSHRFEFGKS